MTRRLYRSVLLVLVVYWLFMFTMTHLPPNVPPQLHVSDKIEHLGAFILLTILLDISLGPKFHARSSWLTLLIVLAYGAVDEMLQPLTHRTADLLDWFADGTGAAIGVAICGLLRAVVGMWRGKPVASAQEDEVDEPAVQR